MIVRLESGGNNALLINKVIIITGGNTYNFNTNSLVLKNNYSSGTPVRWNGLLFGQDNTIGWFDSDSNYPNIREYTGIKNYK